MPPRSTGDGEACDDGGASASCNADCTAKGAAVCGDGFVDTGELSRFFKISKPPDQLTPAQKSRPHIDTCAGAQCEDEGGGFRRGCGGL